LEKLFFILKKINTFAASIKSIDAVILAHPPFRLGGGGRAKKQIEIVLVS
jgi:hypothetical protein